MKTLAVSTRTICGIEELPQHGEAGVTHVLSILDPGHPELSAFGAYGEHRIDSVTLDGRTRKVAGRSFSIRLEPGCGARLKLAMTRYANRPSLAFPWG